MIKFLFGCKVATRLAVHFPQGEGAIDGCRYVAITLRLSWLWVSCRGRTKRQGRSNNGILGEIFEIKGKAFEIASNIELKLEDFKYFVKII